MNLSNHSFRSKDTVQYLSSKSCRRESHAALSFREKLEPLYPEEIVEVENAWKDAEDDKVLSRLSRDHVDGGSLHLLRPEWWLSCESKRLEQVEGCNTMYVASKKQKAKMFCKKEWEKTLTWERSVIPQQHNSYYRGVYVIVFADFFIRWLGSVECVPQYICILSPIIYFAVEFLVLVMNWANSKKGVFPVHIIVVSPAPPLLLAATATSTAVAVHCSCCTTPLPPA